MASITKRCSECNKWYEAKRKDSSVCGIAKCRKAHKAKMRRKWSQRPDVKEKLRNYQSSYMKKYLSDPVKKQRFLDQQKEYRSSEEVKRHRRLARGLRKKKTEEE
tara:strand:+ start:61 stop:375 length:315 start_codon:yes stop_codon:yes gene_type:complete